MTAPVGPYCDADRRPVGGSTVPAPTSEEPGVDELAPRPATRPAPDPRLLFVLVLAVLVGTVLLVTTFGGADEDRRVRLGTLGEVLTTMTSDPLVLAEVPGVVVTRTGRDGLPDLPRWGEADGSLPLDRNEALFALSLRDPADGATLAWCSSSRRFEHPSAERAYGLDGRLLDGDAPRGMDRRAIAIGAGGQVVVDPARWVAGVPVDATDGEVRAAGPSCATGP